MVSPWRATAPRSRTDPGRPPRSLRGTTGLCALAMAAPTAPTQPTRRTSPRRGGRRPPFCSIGSVARGRPAVDIVIAADRAIFVKMKPPIRQQFDLRILIARIFENAGLRYRPGRVVIVFIVSLQSIGSVGNAAAIVPAESLSGQILRGYRLSAAKIRNCTSGGRPRRHPKQSAVEQTSLQRCHDVSRLPRGGSDAFIVFDGWRV